MIRMQQFGHDVWALVQGYWRSEERWSAWALLTAIIGLDLVCIHQRAAEQGERQRLQRPAAV